MRTFWEKATLIHVVPTASMAFISNFLVLKAEGTQYPTEWE
ncbi:MAG: hypothetical protein NUW01_13120 [Gemmatimonadaceae bacterium]|nr:hypothetical protein [Gemmatimonadaceae bacterium]